MSTPEPPALARGESGLVRLATGRVIGTLQAWRLVMSPTTNKPTLIAEAAYIQRYYVGQNLGLVDAVVTPRPQPAYIGRKKPPTPAPFVLRGRVALLRANAITIAEGEYVRE